jgi:2-polyprenyl-6-methoxyphenol hydroxylase-like FAD-dependent oxidoreductase
VIAMTGQDRHAVVIGASIAGVLAARALADHYHRVTLVDRDEMPSRPVVRGGVPQGRHVHGVLSSGLGVIERLFPGTTHDLVSRGAQLGDAQADVRYYFGPRPLAVGHAGLPALGVSRPLLEWYLRRRLLQDRRVELLDRTSVLDLAFSAGERRVVGLVVTDCDAESPRLLPAMLVVDASGRTSRTTEWLERRGHPVPPEDVRRVDKHYATRAFRQARRAGQPMVLTAPATPDRPRGGVMIAQEDDVWTVSLYCRGGARPPLGLDEFRAWARTLSSPALAEAIDTMIPLDEGARFRFPANRRRHYELLDRFPPGLVVTGDALCAFDPVYAQGMSVAALEAEALERSLRKGVVGLARRFHAAAAATIDTPWAIAAAPAADAPAPLRARMIQRYMGRLIRSAADDPVLAAAFLRVNHLVDQPQDLLRPSVALRVLRASRSPLPHSAVRATRHPGRRTGLIEASRSAPM